MICACAQGWGVIRVAMTVVVVVVVAVVVSQPEPVNCLRLSDVGRSRKRTVPFSLCAYVRMHAGYIDGSTGILLCLFDWPNTK